MNDPVAQHYRQDGLTDRILRELGRAMPDLDELRPSHLAGVDEFHLGGRFATEALLGELGLTARSRVLDVGCGIGGAARTIASTVGCSVTGVDLTAEFVATATDLSAAVGLGDVTSFDLGDALGLPFADDSFDAVLLLHVGMNVADKPAMMKELERVLQPGGTLAVYDIMRVGAGDLTYPVPWASDASASFVAPLGDYRDAMIGAGFTPQEPIDCLDLVRDAMRTISLSPPPVNLSHLMGDDWSTMFANLVAALDGGVVSPTRILARRSEK